MARHTGIHRFLHAALFALPKHQANTWWRNMTKLYIFITYHDNYAIWCYSNIRRHSPFTFTYSIYKHIKLHIKKESKESKEREGERVSTKSRRHYHWIIWIILIILTHPYVASPPGLPTLQQLRQAPPHPMCLGLTWRRFSSTRWPSGSRCVKLLQAWHLQIWKINWLLMLIIVNGYYYYCY